MAQIAKGKGNQLSPYIGKVFKNIFTDSFFICKDVVPRTEHVNRRFILQNMDDPKDRIMLSNYSFSAYYDLYEVPPKLDNDLI